MRALGTIRRIAQLGTTTTHSSSAMSSRQPFCSATLSPAVVHNPSEQRFVLPIDGHEAELLYRLKGTTMHLDHTGVPKELEGRGLGKILAKVAFEHVASTNLKMKVHCDFLQNYLEKYAPEFKQYEA